MMPTSQWYELCASDAPEAMRALLMEWVKYAQTLAVAGIVAYPDPLIGRSVGLLDATAV